MVMDFVEYNQKICRSKKYLALNVVNASNIGFHTMKNITM